MAIYNLVEKIPSNIYTSDILNCPYSGKEISIKLPKGKYKLECWGAQGGNALSYGSVGGKGGYSCGTLTLNDKTMIYLYVGEKGNELEASDNTYGDGISQITQRSFNGGGYGFAKDFKGYPKYFAAVGSGGGASDIRINTDNIYARIIVAGGGGGAAFLAGYNEHGNGGAAGGLEGLPGGVGSSGYQTYYARGGTQTSGGTGTSKAYDYGTTNVEILNGYTVSGTFYYGADMSLKPQSGSWSSACGGGGGGWYGGAAGCKNAGGGGGGSGYVYTVDTASNYPKGCLLNSSYYLTDAETIAGNQSITSPDGSITTGNSGNGYIRITVIELEIELEQLPLWIKENNVWIKGNKLYEKNNGIWRLLESPQIESTINAKKINKPKYIWKKFENKEDNHTLLLISDTLEDRVGGHSITNNGVELSTNQSKFGGSSLYFGGNQYLTINDVSLCNGSGDWTVDWWEYRTAAIGNTGTISRNGNNDNYSGLLLGYVDSIDGTLKFYASNNSSSWNMVDSMASGFPTLNQWIHRCVVRSSNTFYAFENGILKGSANSSETFSFTKPINIGYYLGGCFSGYMNEIRISDIARWTADFTPPTESYNYTLIGYVESENSNAYPDNGLADDGYYYKKL